MATATRRTQAERSAETTAKLLDATAACLVERGYGGTTTTEVVRRAGVSRGALLHHFPTKDDLVAAAVAHVVDLRVEEFRATLSTLPPDTGVVDRLETAIDVLWSIFRGPTVAAWIELVVAARTDEHLREHVSAVSERLDQAVQRVWTELFAGETDLPPGFFDVAPAFILALLDGLVVDRLSGSPDASGRADLVVVATKLIVRTMADVPVDTIARHLSDLLEDRDADRPDHDA